MVRDPVRIECESADLREIKGKEKLWYRLRVEINEKEPYYVEKSYSELLDFQQDVRKYVNGNWLPRESQFGQFGE
eukprot:COSAG02_NODE_30064_length_558_cov_0.546841_2_plen_74_part_01